MPKTALTRDIASLCFKRAYLGWRDSVIFDSTYLCPTDFDSRTRDASHVMGNLDWSVPMLSAEIGPTMVDAGHTAGVSA